ncbi:hypothetical protein MNQ98_04370 [Paenibacillus sp. N3/727]|uniref:hypothetical protein n=1 Tax=Paenibacillus sp. N3/727 TaxID=2925845 RepID=UPI001F537F86|nr:hypothetical protein [Paenibacillus sp. N3/727]UNK19279.1 hypothetical protein MNQ98_04370 [Paenibacillus sp. N3/727]
MIVTHFQDNNNKYEDLVETFLKQEYSDIKSLRNVKNLIKIYCDASTGNPNNKAIGIGISIVGQKKVFFESEIQKVEKNNIDSIYGELLAVEFATKKLYKMLEDNTYNLAKLERVIIYSDCIGIDRLISKALISKEIFTEVVTRINEQLQILSDSYPKLIFTVKYLTQGKKCFYYKMADRISKGVIARELITTSYNKENFFIDRFKSELTKIKTELMSIKNSGLDSDYMVCNIDEKIAKLEHLFSVNRLDLEICWGKLSTLEREICRLKSIDEAI